MSLFAALHSRDVAGAARQLAAGADPDAEQDGVSALTLAIRLGDADLVDLLLRSGASVRAPTAGNPPLVEAVLAGSPQLVRRLIAAGAHTGSLGEETVLSLAVVESPATVHELLNHGVDPRERRHDGWDPLMLAAWRGDLPCVHLLLEHGADPTATVGERMMDAATIAAVHGHAACRDTLSAAARQVRPDLGDLWDRIAAWCAEHAPELHQAFENTVLNTASPEDWAPLPRDAAQQLAHWPSGLPFFGGMESLGGARAIETWRQQCEKDWPDEPPHVGDEPIRPVWWDPAWVPVARSGSGDLLFVDRAPLATGVVGQVVHWERRRGPRAVVASSLTAYLVHLHEMLESGGIRYVPREGALLYR